MTRALVVGEALVDVLGGVPHPGGSPLNVAVGLARLGVGATLHTRIGRDAHGDAIERHLHSSGVTLSAESRDPRPTSVAEVTVGPDGAPVYRFALDSHLATPGTAPSGYAVLHVGSIAAVLDAGADVVGTLVAAARPDTTVSYDPNVRPQLIGEGARRRIEALAGSSRRDQGQR